MRFFLRHEEEALADKIAELRASLYELEAGYNVIKKFREASYYDGQIKDARERMAKLMKAHQERDLISVVTERGSIECNR